MGSQLDSKSTFVHSGIISNIKGNAIIVTLEQNIHCESCRAKAACGISESNTKEIEIINSRDTFKLNENVNVVLKKALGLKAVFWAYVFPFLVMFSSLIIASTFLIEWQAGLISILVLIPYYFILYVLKNTFKKALEISILKI
ncbi:SoxR reducing system RseC family protein [Aureibaculum luteum]|uniref:SoxR reducing system RseC family protein n=1 Tax=Aureibaculum luteum TaxID=1548456 RepID=UPI000E47FCE5|nr:SoxR reducing system RseC family protein [Aureibaculum luteum]